MSVIFNTEEERIAVEYFSRINNTIGAVGIGICFTLLQFENPAKLAWISFIIFMTWSFTQGFEYRKMLKRSTPDSKPSFWMFLKYGWLSYVALLFMGSIAMELVSRAWLIN